MKKFLFYTLCFLLAVIFVALIAQPKRYAQACTQGLLLWAVSVLPSLLPFFFITLLATNLGIARVISTKAAPLTAKLYRTGGASAFVQLMSFISGYPVGAKLISQLYEQKQIDKEQAEKMSVFCSTSGPAFVIGSVGAVMLNQASHGFILYFCHIASAVITGIIFRKSGVNARIEPLQYGKGNGGDNILYDCAYGATLSCLTVGTFVAIFYVFAEILIDFKILSPFILLLELILGNKKQAKGFAVGLIECTIGCSTIAQSSNFFTLPLICFLLSFGGASVIIQSLAFLKKAKVSGRFFILGKLLSAVIAFFLCALLCLIFNV